MSSNHHNANSILASDLPIDAMEEPKRCRPDEASSKNEKAPKLPSDCRIPIFKFLPTSELVRFVSKSLSLLGEYWSHDLKFVVEQRLPLAVHCDPLIITQEEGPKTGGEMGLKFVLVDCLKNRIADIKQPGLFHFSPLSELTESVDLPAKFHDSDSPLGALMGKELLAPLVNLRSLKLNINPYFEPRGCAELPLDFTSLAPDIQQTLSQVESLLLDPKLFFHFSLSTFLLRGFESLQKLVVGMDEFCAAMPVMVPFRRLLEHRNLPQDGAEVLARLESLCICGEYDYAVIVPLAMRQILHFLGTNCVQLSELSLPLSGEVSHYMPVFRAMPNLVKLALNVHSLESNGKSQNT